MRFAEVAVDAPTGHDRTFTYSVPPSLEVGPGHLVWVPFGPRRLQGLVFAVGPVSQVPRTRDILSAIFPMAVLSEAQLSLARWLSQYYMCSLFEAAACMLPPGGHVRPRAYLSVAEGAAVPGDAPLTEAQQRVLDYVRARGRAETEEVLLRLGQRARTPVQQLLRLGLLTRASSPARPLIGHRQLEYARLAPDVSPEALAQQLPALQQRAPRQAALLARLAQQDAGPLELAQARREYGASAVNALLTRGWLQKETRVLERDPLAGRTFATPPAITLTPPQTALVAEISQVLDSPQQAPRAFLMEGVTGSGKTEVYLAATEHCLATGKRAIVLVPEISLTGQTIERFASRFPGRVTTLHSRLTPGERFDQWWRIRQGHYGIVIGSRSAVFAPQPDLGLIIIDEEHEWTYKQHDVSPRYHAREVALRLSELTGAVVVMGSASPDVASYYRGLKGEFRLRRLPYRMVANGATSATGAVRAPLPSVQIVDMRQELRDGNRHMFSRALVSAMEATLEAEGQAILFLNRRGTASHMQCRSCGTSLRCRRCDIALTFHRELGRLLCHYCGYRRTAPVRCPQCLSHRVGFYGIGTQAVAEAVQELFPEARVLRWDSDATRGHEDYEDLLERFRSGEARVLVGTQMIAKGLHFPAVTLVGVVSADVGLQVPDYRAGERAFQLLCQVAGRAGRGPQKGRVIVQTYQPDNYAIQAAASQDYQRFYRQEMAFRRQQGNPPYSKLIRLLFSHTNRALCEQEATRLGRLIKQQQEAWGLSNVEMLGPTPAYPSRLRGRYRWHIVLRGPEPRRLLEKVTLPQSWTVDIDPVVLT